MLRYRKRSDLFNQFVGAIEQCGPHPDERTRLDESPDTLLPFRHVPTYLLSAAVRRLGGAQRPRHKKAMAILYRLS